MCDLSWSIPSRPVDPVKVLGLQPQRCGRRPEVESALIMLDLEIVTGHSIEPYELLGDLLWMGRIDALESIREPKRDGGR